MTDQNILDAITKAADALNEAISQLPNGYMVMMDTSAGAITGVIKEDDKWSSYAPHVKLAIFKHEQNSKPVELDNLSFNVGTTAGLASLSNSNKRPHGSTSP